MSESLDAEDIVNMLLSGELSEEVPEDELENLLEDILDNYSEAFLDKFEQRFPEISRKSRPIEEVIEEFRDSKLEEVDSTDHYDTKIDYIEDYFKSEVAAETTDEITSEDVERYRNWRKFDSLDRQEPLADSTLSDDMYLFGDLVGYLSKHRMVPSRFKQLVEPPDLDPGEGVDEKELDPKIANAATSYLKKYHRASIEHVIMEIACQAGPRLSGLYSLDVDDYDDDDENPTLSFEHSEETPLKHDEESNREIKLRGDLPQILDECLEEHRPPETDEFGREPLLTKGNGRMSRSDIKKTVYKWSRPCEIGLECPHDRDPTECEAAQRNNSAYKCPSSRAPHHVRTGFITAKRDAGAHPDSIDQRCDVQERTQDKHYHHPDDEDVRKRAEEDFDTLEEDPDSGYSF